MVEKKDIAYQVYRAKKKMNVFDLLYECGIAYEELKPLLDECVAEKILATDDGRNYEFIGDGRMFSAKYKRENFRRFAKELIKSSVREEGGTKDDPEEVDKEKEKKMEQFRAEIEARRQAIIKKMQEELDENEEEDETEEEDDDDEISSEEEVLFEELRIANKIMMGGGYGEDETDESELRQNGNRLSGSILNSLKEGIAVRKCGDSYLIEIEGIDLYATDAKFELFPFEGKVYLCDQGSTIDSLKETDALNDEARGRITNIAAESGAEIIDEKLCVEVTSPERTLACLFRLYAVMERVYHIRDNIF